MPFIRTGLLRSINSAVKGNKYITTFSTPALAPKGSGNVISDDMLEILSDIKIFNSVDLSSTKDNSAEDRIASEKIFFDHQNAWEGFSQKSNIESLVGKIPE
ncbi:hypothetical protein AYI69_g10529 [Smittium culicis]|uniref:Uncharacterized protein n=1 Tax=Smittium culicis TaxID=133412 RepID=A0A1R1X544_9FUNG|nr:hypothetical protein AYI69_g10529 [Smittium culicis]